ncbi:MAG: flagellar hook-associated protein FlgK [Halobacteriovoraceae bacterium]|nr:flagellar hook-associated protein FlgK [Halobacteriovoraceae bacterium]
MANILGIGNSGLIAAKKSLETTGHNIANVNTEGYSRQRVMQQSNVPINHSGLIQGTGVRVRSVDRIHDKFVEQRLQKATSQESFSNHRFEELTQIENIFNELDSDGLNNIINKFYNAFRELSAQPDNETMRSVVRDTANLVVKDFNRIRSSLDGLSRNIDAKIDGEITDINAIAKNITQLNVKIAELEAGGSETGDLRDQRDMAIRELSKSFKIHTYSDEKNNFIVAAVGVGTLVAGSQYQELAAAGTALSDSSSGMDGSVEVFFKSRPAHKITHKFKSGRLSSLIKVRNEDIRKNQEEIDQIAFDFAKSVNAIHNRGYVGRPVQEFEDGRTVASDAKGPVTGINFFKISSTADGAAQSLSLSDEVESDISNIVTALTPNSPGDNRISLAISKLQHEKFMAGGTATIEEQYLKTVGNVGVEVGKAKLDAEQNEGIRVQVETIKERTSGVSLDEEAANMVKFQHAYDAAAKVMQTANEMFETVLSIKR